MAGGARPGRAAAGGTDGQAAHVRAGCQARAQAAVAFRVSATSAAKSFASASRPSPTCGAGTAWQEVARARVASVRARAARRSSCAARPEPAGRRRRPAHLHPQEGGEAQLRAQLLAALLQHVLHLQGWAGSRGWRGWGAAAQAAQARGREPAAAAAEAAAVLAAAACGGPASRQTLTAHPGPAFRPLVQDGGQGCSSPGAAALPAPAPQTTSHQLPPWTRLQALVQDGGQGCSGGQPLGAGPAVRCRQRQEPQRAKGRTLRSWSRMNGCSSRHTSP